MKKIWSLIKACMTSDMAIFKLNIKGKSKTTKLIIIGLIVICFMISTWSYAQMLLEQLAPVNMGFIALALFVFIIAIMTLIEGVYKSGSLLFNCKDDELLLSLPIRKSTVLFIRILKFYLFELLFSLLFTIPLVISYAVHVKVAFSFYIVSAVICLLIPIIPIILSCIIGAMTSWISSKTRFKNIIQIILSMMLVLGILYVSFNLNHFIENIASKASDIYDLISKIYYPAGAYASLAVNFNIIELLKLIGVHVLLSIVTIFVLSSFYFKINSDVKSINVSKKPKTKLQIKKHSQIGVLVKKELNTFFQTPVFIINAGFGVVLFFIAVFSILFKYDNFILTLEEYYMTVDMISKNIPAYLILVVAMGAFTTSITSSMISLEGRNYYYLKSLPVSPKKILMAKVYASSLLTIPAFILGDILLFIKFKLNLICMILILLLTVLMPLVSHFVGLIINLKFPKLEYENIAEVVKQSISAFASVMLGFVFLLLTSLLIYFFTKIEINSIAILFMMTIIFLIMDLTLYFYLVNRGTYLFNNLDS